LSDACSRQTGEDCEDQWRQGDQYVEILRHVLGYEREVEDWPVAEELVFV